jgi:3-polyprenyl-4-hydroxybenzoate decarboxylase
MARAELVEVSPSLASYRGLRDWIARVDQMGELLRVNGAHWDKEMGAIAQMLTENSKGTAPAILFDEVPGYPMGFRTLYGHLSTIRRIALTLGLPLDLGWRCSSNGRGHPFQSRGPCRLPFSLLRGPPRRGRYAGSQD